MSLVGAGIGLQWKLARSAAGLLIALMPACAALAQSDPDAAERARMHLEIGDRQCAAQQFDLAIQEYTRALELKPDFAEAYNNRAYATVSKYDGTGHPLEDLNRALTLRTNFPHAYNTRGCVHLARGDTALAIADFNRAIALQPDYPRAYKNRGSGYLRQGKIQLAMADLERAGGHPKRVLMVLFGIVALVVGLTVAAGYVLKRSHEVTVREHGD